MILLVGCSKEELKPLFYTYDANQPTVVDADVFIMEHAIVTFESMEKEVNADYFHRYGIHINIELDSNRISLPDKVKFGTTIFFPEKKETLSIYIIPHEYMNVIGAAGYAMLGRNCIVISERSIRKSTLAHEIGHIFGLGHMEERKNVMHPVSGANKNEQPDYFLEQQIDTMLRNINPLIEVKLKTNNIIID